MAADETLYITTNEAALAVVATAMKKARLLLTTLVINSFLGGLVFASGGMLHVLVEGTLPQIYDTNPGIVFLLQGIVYPIGLFYVVILGADLFNSNVLFFSVGVARRAVSILDLAVSWFVSWWFNLVGNIFVCFIICHFSDAASTPDYIQGSIQVVMKKVSSSFTHTLIKGMAGNFFVCLAVYLQLMTKPIHVKFLMMLLPIFTFVSMGFTHSVADMFMLTIGLINGAPVSTKKVVWKVMVPGLLGNIIGGCFFSLLIPWYLHIVVVEQDIDKLQLPKYEYRDEQPELNQDSRVVRLKANSRDDLVEDDIDELDDDEVEYGGNSIDFAGYSPKARQDPGQAIEEENNLQYILKEGVASSGSSIPSTDNDAASAFPQPVAYARDEEVQSLSRATSRVSGFSTNTLKRRNTIGRSPKNVFPVYGMRSPPERERNIASGRTKNPNFANRANPNETTTYPGGLEPEVVSSAEYLGDTLKRVISRQTSRRNDLERQSSIVPRSSINLPRERRRSSVSVYSRAGPFSRRMSLKPSAADIGRRMSEVGITQRAAGAADEIAGIANIPVITTITKPRKAASKSFELTRSAQSSENNNKE